MLMPKIIDINIPIILIALARGEGHKEQECLPDLVNLLLPMLTHC